MPGPEVTQYSEVIQYFQCVCVLTEIDTKRSSVEFSTGGAISLLRVGL
jgi:hypothetical protein